MTPSITPSAPVKESLDIYTRRRAQMRILIDQRSAGNIAAFADQFGYSRSRVSQFLSEIYNDGRSIGERAARAMEEVAGLPIGWLDAAPASLLNSQDTPIDHAAELRGAITQTRQVFESVPAANDVLNYLQALLDVNASYTGVHAAGRAAPLREGAPVPSGVISPTETGSDDLRARMLALAGDVADARHQAKQDKVNIGHLREENRNLINKLHAAENRAYTAEQRALALFGPATPAAGGADASKPKETHTVAGAEPVVGQVDATLADKAAAAMRAESAQLMADAERTVAGAAARAAVDPLTKLSREVFSLADKLQQPADLVVQLLVLAELRGVRAEFIQQVAMPESETELISPVGGSQPISLSRRRPARMQPPAPQASLG